VTVVSRNLSQHLGTECVSKVTRRYFLQANSLQVLASRAIITMYDHTVSANSTRRVLASSTLLSSAHTMAEFTYWLCQLDETVDNNNTADYEPCVATPYHRLELIRLPTPGSPGFAGISLELVVLKKDMHGQIIKADSLSSLQLYSALDDSKDNDPSITFIGSIFAVVQAGSAIFCVTVMPTFASVIVLDGHTTLQRKLFLFTKGNDSTTGSVIQKEVQPVNLSSHNRPACPIGYVLVLDSSDDTKTRGACIQCDLLTYNVNPLTGICPRGPMFAACNHGGPPLSGASKVEGEIKMALPDSSCDNTKSAALATRLGVSF